MALIKGSAGVLSIWDADETIPLYEPVACVTSFTITTDTTVLETNNSCAPNTTTREPDKRSFTVSVDGDYLDTTSVTGDTAKIGHDYLLSKQLSNTKVYVKLETGLADTTYYGYVIISSLNLDMAQTDFGKFSATFTGDGDVLTVDPNI